MPVPVPGMMPFSSTYIVEKDGVPLLSVSLYLTNTPEICFVENFIGNPSVKGPLRKEAGLLLQEHIAGEAKRLGFKRLMCMTYQPGLVSRYEQLGYKPCATGGTTLVCNL